MALRSQRLRLAPPAADTDAQPGRGGLVLAPLTEREHQVAGWALEEVGAAVEDFRGSDSGGLGELGELRDALAVSLADHRSHSEGGLRWCWQRLRRRRHTLDAVLVRYGVEPEAPKTGRPTR